MLPSKGASCANRANGNGGTVRRSTQSQDLGRRLLGGKVWEVINTTAAEHKISVELTGSGAYGAWVWHCTCGASGNEHEKHQQAMNHGIQHLRIEAEL